MKKVQSKITTKLSENTDPQKVSLDATYGGKILHADACRLPSVFNTWARSYVDRGRRLEENELFKTLHFSLCCVRCKFAMWLEGRPGAVVSRGAEATADTLLPTATPCSWRLSIRPLHWAGRPMGGLGQPRPAKCQEITVHLIFVPSNP